MTSNIAICYLWWTPRLQDGKCDNFHIASKEKRYTSANTVNVMVERKEKIRVPTMLPWSTPLVTNLGSDVKQITWIIEFLEGNYNKNQKYCRIQFYLETYDGTLPKHLSRLKDYYN